MSKIKPDVFLQFIKKICEQNELQTQAIQRVRELHKETHCACCPSEETICSFCDHDYPCPTIKALDREQ